MVLPFFDATSVGERDQFPESGRPAAFCPDSGQGATVHQLIRSENFWVVLIAVVIPFGWLYPLLRFAYRSISR